MHRLGCRECEVGDNELSETLVFICEWIRCHIPDGLKPKSRRHKLLTVSVRTYSARTHTHTHRDTYIPEIKARTEDISTFGTKNKFM